MARAKFGYQLVSEDKTKEGIKSAQDGLKNLEGSMKNVNKVAATLMGAGAIAGVTMALRKLYQGAAECETAFLKLHPELTNAVGSAKEFGDTMTSLKAAIGGAINSGISPLRAEIVGLARDWETAITSAVNYKNAMKNLNLYEGGASIKSRLGAAKTAGDQYATQIYALQSMKYEGVKSADDLAKIDDQIRVISQLQYQEAIRQSKAMADAIALFKSGESPVQSKASGGAAAAAAAIVKEVFRGDYSVFGNQNADIAASMRGRMPEWAKGFGFGFGQTGKAPAGETDWFMEQRANALGAASAARNPVAAIDPLMQALGMLGGQFQSVAMIMQPLQVIFDSMMKVLTPIVDSLLSPIIGALVILGEALGKMLIPVIQILAPVIKVVSEAFVWLYNKVIRPFGSAIILIGNILYNAIASIYNWVSWLWGGTKMALRGLQEGFLEEISLGSLSTAGTQYQQSQAGGGNSASYTQARPITVNVVVNTDVITGEHGGFRELAIKMQNEIEAVLALGLA